MSDKAREIERLVAEPPDRCYLLVKRGLYYRPDSQGYTGIKDHAGRYFQSDACPESGVAAIHESEAPEFSPACFHDLALDHLRTKLTAAQERIAALEGAAKLVVNDYPVASGMAKGVTGYPECGYGSIRSLRHVLEHPARAALQTDGGAK